MRINLETGEILFGSWRGKKLQEVPYQYLQWMMLSVKALNHDEYWRVHAVWEQKKEASAAEVVADGPTLADLCAPDDK